MPKGSEDAVRTRRACRRWAEEGLELRSHWVRSAEDLVVELHVEEVLPRGHDVAEGQNAGRGILAHGHLQREAEVSPRRLLDRSLRGVGRSESGHEIQRWKITHLLRVLEPLTEARVDVADDEAGVMEEEGWDGGLEGFGEHWEAQRLPEILLLPESAKLLGPRVWRLGGDCLEPFEN